MHFSYIAVYLIYFRMHTRVCIIPGSLKKKLYRKASIKDMCKILIIMGDGYMEIH